MSNITTYERPKTRGELRDKLQAGIVCEVAAHVAEINVFLSHLADECLPPVQKVKEQPKNKAVLFINGAPTKPTHWKSNCCGECSHFVVTDLAPFGDGTGRVLYRGSCGLGHRCGPYGASMKVLDCTDFDIKEMHELKG